jgi:hypothetical protein
VQIKGWNWPTGGEVAQFGIHWDGYGNRVGVVAVPSASFTYDLVRDVARGDHTIVVSTERADGSPAPGALVEIPFVVPCPAPNLVVDRVSLASTPPFSTYQRLDFVVQVRNNGSMPASSLFWTDIFEEYPATPPTAGFGWGAISALGVNASKRITITRHFETTGTYGIWALADSAAQVREMYEEDNTGSMTSTFVISQTGASSVISGTERIVGATWVSLTGVPVPQGRAEVWCVDEGTGQVVLTTYSNANAQYMLDGIRAGLYTVVAQVWIDGIRFYGMRTGVVVTAGAVSNALVIMYRY